MPYDVIWYDSDETGAPTMNNVAGSLISVLDACLINGFNSKSVTSLVVASNVATATVSAHGYETGRILEMAGATPSGLNGKKKITVTGSNTFTFTTSGISDQTATGTITCKRAPLAWAKTYTGTNKAVYTRGDPAATLMKLRVDDTGAGVAGVNYARATMYETMADIDIGTGLSPPSANLSGGAYWSKGANSSTAKKWVLIGDGFMFYLFTEGLNNPFASQNGLFGNAFGDVIPYKSGDAYHCVLIGSDTTADANAFAVGQALTTAPTSYGYVFARAYSQIGSTIRAGSVGFNGGGQLGGAGLPVFPSVVDNGVPLARVLIHESAQTLGNPIRGEMPGQYQPVGDVPVSMHKSIIDSILNFSGPMLVITAMNASSKGSVFFDTTGPWR